MKCKWRNDRRSECNLCNRVKKTDKNSGLQQGLNLSHHHLPVRCSTNWAMKPLTLGAGQLWVHMFPWKKWVLMIYEINHMWTAEMKRKWRNDRRSECNLCNCVKKPFFSCFFTQLHKLHSLQRSFPHFHFISAVHVYDLFHISLTLISFTGTYESTSDLLPTSVAS